MPICKKCRGYFQYMPIIKGKRRNLGSRKFCLKCSPYKQHNTMDLSLLKIHNEVEKQCTKCKIVKPINQYYHNQGKKFGQSYCKKCFNQQINDIQINKKLKAIKYLGGKCKNCGFNKPQALVFHHKNGKKDKEFSWSNLKSRKWEKIEKEINKCDLLCANCHLITHSGKWEQ